MGCVRLKVYAPLGRAAGRVFDLDLPQPSPVADLLRVAAEKQGFTDQLFDESGHFKRSYTILLNGVSLYHLDGVNTLVRDGDEIAILAFVAGGAPSPYSPNPLSPLPTLGEGRGGGGGEG